MPDLVIDFGDGTMGSSNNGAVPNGDTPDITGNKPDKNGNDITNSDGNNGNKDGNNQPTVVDDGNTDNTGNNGDGSNNGEDGATDDNSSTGDVEPGDIVNFDGVDYTVAENGDIVDDKGNVFKKADEVQDWLKSLDVSDDNSLEDTNIQSLIDAVGIEVKDENGNNIEFTNDKEGLKSYVEAVIETKVNEATAGTINKFYEDNPLVKQFVDYVTVNNGDYRGFGQILDRSGITIDKDNEYQQEQIIKMAAHEFGNDSLDDTYIKYLKDNGGLYDVAKKQLEALVRKDNEYREELTRRAKEMREAEEQAVQEYWGKVNDIITSRKIAGYKLPNSFVKEVNGQKMTLTPDDFYDYLYKAKYTDAKGNKITGYKRDLGKLTQDEIINQDLLSAWLTFTGGSYKDLADMAIKEREVRKLVLTSKQNRTSRTVRVSKPAKGNISDIILS